MLFFSTILFFHLPSLLIALTHPVVTLIFLNFPLFLKLFVFLNLSAMLPFSKNTLPFGIYLLNMSTSKEGGHRYLCHGIRNCPQSDHRTCLIMYP